MVNYFTLFSLYGPLLMRVIPKFCPFCSICKGYRHRPPLPVFKVKGHQVTYLHFFQVIPKFCPFHSICDGYRDKRPLPVFKGKGLG